MSQIKKSKSKHDAEVKKIAKELEEKGFEVKADLPGFSKPDTIQGLRPDIIAKKGKQQRIIEVETPESLKSARDLKQQEAFRKEANKRRNTTFRRKVTN